MKGTKVTPGKHESTKLAARRRNATFLSRSLFSSRSRVFKREVQTTALKWSLMSMGSVGHRTKVSYENTRRSRGSDLMSSGMGSVRYLIKVIQERPESEKKSWMWCRTEIMIS